MIDLFSHTWGMSGILYASQAADFLTGLVIVCLLWYDRENKRNEV